MKEFLNKHYEKFLFGLSILALAVVALLCFNGAKFLISTFNVATSEVRVVDQSIIFDIEKAEQVGIQRR